MPRLLRYNTEGVVPENIPDSSLAVIEHASLFYLIDQRVANKFQKYLTFIVLGAGYEFIINDMKNKDARTNGKTM